MDSEKILEALAPCGLDCQRCLSHTDGEIKAESIKLKNLLGNFDKYAEKFSAFVPIFENYPQFKMFLEFLTQGDCTGCRNGECKNQGCMILQCYQKKGVNFCFQCDDFPCEKMDGDTHLKARWIQMNTRMKDIGVEAYFQETRNSPRYR